MDIKELIKEREELLDRLKEELNGELIASDIRKAQKKEEPDILRVIFDDMGMEGQEQVLGEYFFLPFSGDEPAAHHFMAVLTIADDLENAPMEALFEAMSYINSVLPYGAYNIDREKKFLTFKMTLPVSVELEAEDIYREMNLLMANSLALVDVHMDLLLKLIDGDIDIEYVKEAI